MLSAYQDVRGDHPNLTGEALYERILVCHRGYDARSARELVDRADQSLAQWPRVRDLVFRDVVLYLVASELLISEGTGGGIRTDSCRVVGSVISAEL